MFFGGVEEAEMRYKIVRKVGEGTFGKVYLGKDQKTLKKVAVKRIKIKEQEDALSLYLIREISILKALSHKNVIRLLDTFIRDRKKVHSFEKDSYTICMVFPYVKTDLLSLIKNTHIRVDDIVHYTKQILCGLVYLHSKQIIHRDIKPSNILISCNKRVKIADFGLSRLATDGNMTHGVVTRIYRSPEVLLGAKEYTTSIDIWSLGCIIGEMLMRRPLFTGAADIDILKCISSLCGEIRIGVVENSKIDENMKQIIIGKDKKPVISEAFGGNSTLLAFLMEKMLEIDKRKRITAKKALFYCK